MKQVSNTDINKLKWSFNHFAHIPRFLLYTTRTLQGILHFRMISRMMYWKRYSEVFLWICGFIVCCFGCCISIYFFYFTFLLYYFQSITFILLDAKREIEHLYEKIVLLSPKEIYCCLYKLLSCSKTFISVSQLLFF